MSEPLPARIAEAKARATHEHNSGFMMGENGDGNLGDGLHWLVCVDCGAEWAEHDDGSLAAGSSICGAANRDVLFLADQLARALAVIEAATTDMQNALGTGDGLVYVHQADDGRAKWVVMTLDRFQREKGGSDPGHDDNYSHAHVVLADFDRGEQ